MQENILQMYLTKICAAAASNSEKDACTWIKRLKERLLRSGDSVPSLRPELETVLKLGLLDALAAGVVVGLLP